LSGLYGNHKITYKNKRRRMKRFNKLALYACEKLDKRDTYLKRMGWKYARRIFEISFKAINGYSSYDYKRLGEES
jgi:hypothetical protein